MAGVIETLVNTYSQLLASFPLYVQNFINIFFLVVLVVVYAVLVWKFYRMIGRKNLIQLNLNQYNTSKHAVGTKFLAGILYLTEYVLILPFVVVLWFAGFASFMIVLSDNPDINTILFLSVTIVAAIRMAAYIPKEGQAISQEIAKILPYTLLAVFILNPDFFDFERVITHFSQIPNLFSNIFLYVAFIFGLELILRVFDLLFQALGLHEDPQDEVEN